MILLYRHIKRHHQQRVVIKPVQYSVRMARLDLCLTCFVFFFAMKYTLRDSVNKRLLPSSSVQYTVRILVFVLIPSPLFAKNR